MLHLCVFGNFADPSEPELDKKGVAWVKITANADCFVKNSLQVNLCMHKKLRDAADGLMNFALASAACRVVSRD